MPKEACLVVGMQMTTFKRSENHDMLTKQKNKENGKKMHYAKIKTVLGYDPKILPFCISY